LIPIDVGANLVSLDVLLEGYENLEYPSVIINEEQVLVEILTAGEIIGYLK
jgi:hypothetical protein